MEIKKCSRCGRELPLESFTKLKTSKDGLDYWCKECKRECRKQNYQSNRECELEQMKRYRQEHKEERAQKWKQYYNTLRGFAICSRNGEITADRKHGRIQEDSLPINYPTLEEWMELLLLPDFYDGKQYHFTEMGVDRIDNNKPHIWGNIIPASTAHNKERGRMSFEEYLGRFV